MLEVVTPREPVGTFRLDAARLVQRGHDFLLGLDRGSEVLPYARFDGDTLVAAPDLVAAGAAERFDCVRLWPDFDEEELGLVVLADHGYHSPQVHGWLELVAKPGRMTVKDERGPLFVYRDSLWHDASGRAAGDTVQIYAPSLVEPDGLEPQLAQLRPYSATRPSSLSERATVPA